MSETETRVPLIDEFLESTYTLTKGVKPARLRDAAHLEAIKYRPLLKNANRFALDDDFTEMATRVSTMSTMGELRSRIALATLPYETTWIEFNLHRKMRVLYTLRGEPNREIDKLTPEYLGLLLQRDKTRNHAWAMTVVATPVKSVTSPMPAVYLLDVSGDPKHHNMKTAGYTPFHIQVMEIVDKEGTDLFRIKMGEKEIDLQGKDQHTKDSVFWLTRGMRSMGWGYTKTGIDERRVADYIEKSGEQTPEELLRHTQLGVCPLYEVVMRFHEKMGYEKGVQKWLKEYVADLMENTGILRFTVTVLAMLNDVPVTTRLTQHYGHRRLGLVHKPYMDYHTVTLRLPKTKPVAYIKKLLNHAERQHNRAHMVRQHWRTYLAEDHHWCRPDEHNWIYDHVNGYRLCSKCEAEGRLIHEHPRGDASLGWVTKDYVLTPAQEAMKRKHEERYKKVS